MAGQVMACQVMAGQVMAGPVVLAQPMAGQFMLAPSMLGCPFSQHRLWAGESSRFWLAALVGVIDRRPWWVSSADSIRRCL